MNNLVHETSIIHQRCRVRRVKSVIPLTVLLLPLYKFEPSQQHEWYKTFHGVKGVFYKYRKDV